jgi:hypothetical protein
MFVKLFEHAEVLAHVNQRGSLVGELDLDAPNVSRVLSTAVFVVLDRDLLDSGSLVSRQC